MDKNVIDNATSLGYPVVDLLCNSQSYLASNFQQYVAQVAATSPASCAAR